MDDNEKERKHVLRPAKNRTAATSKQCSQALEPESEKRLGKFMDDVLGRVGHNVSLIPKEQDILGKDDKPPSRGR